MTLKEKLLTNDLLKPVQTLIESGKHEEAFHVLNLFYAYALGEIFNNHISIKSTVSNHHLEITSEDEERIKEYCNGIADSIHPKEKLDYLKDLGKLLSKITNDSFFEEIVHTQERQLFSNVSNFSNVTSNIKLSKNNYNNTKFSSKLSPEAFPNEYTTGDVAKILGVSKETVRRMCENGRFPEAHKTNGRHWRIPNKYFKINVNEAEKAKQFMEPLDRKTKEQLGESVDDLELLIDKT